MSSATTPMSLRAYARYRGWSAPYIVKLIKLYGLPRRADGRIDPVAADAFIRDNAIGAIRIGVVQENAARRRWKAQQAATPPGPARACPGTPKDAARALLEPFRARLVAAIDRELDRFAADINQRRTGA